MLASIYLKEMKECFRDKRTLLLTIILPIIMMTGLTLFYDRLVSDDGAETYSLAVQATDSPEVLELLEGYENIELVKSDNPEEVVKDGEAQAALVLPSGFQEQIQNRQETSVTILGDSFSQNSSSVMAIVTNALAAYERAVIAERLEAEGTDPNLVQPFVINQQEISEEDANINLIALLIPLILSIAVGVGSGPAASDFFAGEKEKKTMEALLMTPVNRFTLLFAKWLTIATMGSVTGIVTLIVVALEITFLTENLKEAVSFGENASLIIALAVMVAIIYAMFIASMLMLTSIIGKTVKESQSYSTPIMMVVVFPGMFITGMGINELTFKHFAIPILNLFSLLKEFLFGIVNYEHILIVLGSNLIAMLVFFLISMSLFMKDKWVMN